MHLRWVQVAFSSQHGKLRKIHFSIAPYNGTLWKIRSSPTKTKNCIWYKCLNYFFYVLCGNRQYTKYVQFNPEYCFKWDKDTLEHCLWDFMETHMYFTDNYSNLYRRSWKYALQWGEMGVKWVEILTRKPREESQRWRKTKSQRVTLGIAENLTDAEKG